MSEAAETTHAEQPATAATAPVGAAFPPAGFVTRRRAAEMLGVSAATLKHWDRAGHGIAGAIVRRPGAAFCKLYRQQDVETKRDTLAAERGTLPEGLIDVADTRKRFGVSRTNWKRWQRKGFVPRGEWVKRRGVATRVRAYTVAQVEAIAAAFDRVGRPYADPARPGVWRVPVMSFRTTVCEAIVDADAVGRIEGKRWNWQDRGDECGSRIVGAECEDDDTGRAAPPLKFAVLGLTTEHHRIAHANGDPLDCRRENLIVRTHSERSAHNRKARTYAGRTPTSQFKGVCYEPGRAKCWRAVIQKDDTTRFLGRFRDEIAAAEAYDAAARELFGEHARPNFPDGVDAWLDEQTRPTTDPAPLPQAA